MMLLVVGRDGDPFGHHPQQERCRPASAPVFGNLVRLGCISGHVDATA